MPNEELDEELDNGSQAGDKPDGDKPAGDKPAGDKPAGDKPAGDKPRGDLRVALREEREANAKLKEQIADHEKRWGALEPFMPDIIDYLEKGGKGKATTGDAPNPAVVEFAEDFEVRDKDGNLDLKRAEKLMRRIDERADAVAARRVEPVSRLTHTERASTMRERAHNIKLPEDGEPIASQEYIDKVMDALPPEFQSNPEVVNVAMIIAAGLETLSDRKKGRSRSREPLSLEGGGRRGFRPGELTGLERAAAQARGKTAEQWQKAAKDDSDILEDI